MLPCQPGGEGHSVVRVSQAKALPDVFNNLLWKDFSRACLLRDNNQGAGDACLLLHKQQKRWSKSSSASSHFTCGPPVCSGYLWNIYVTFLLAQHVRCTVQLPRSGKTKQGIWLPSNFLNYWNIYIYIVHSKSRLTVNKRNVCFCICFILHHVSNRFRC